MKMKRCIVLFIMIMIFLGFSTYAEDYNSLIEKGKTYQKNGKYEDALAMYQLALEIVPDSEEVQLELVKLHNYLSGYRKTTSKITKIELANKFSSRGVDSEKPTIDVSSISLDKNFATVGDTITISLIINDNVGVRSAAIYFENKDNNNWITGNQLAYNNATSRWECTFNINQGTPNGLYYISDIIAYDAMNNYSVAFPNLEAFTIYGAAESEAPVVYIASITTSKNTATVGEEIIISIKLSDNNEVRRGYIYFSNSYNKNWYSDFPLEYNEITHQWEYIFTVKNTTPNGAYILSDIIVYDSVGNYVVEHPNMEVFTIYGAAEAEPPIIDVDSIMFSTTSATIGDTVLISVDITDNVKVQRTYITLENDLAGNSISSIPMTYNEISEKWEYNFKISNKIPDGTWRVDSIMSYDNIGNYSVVFPSKKEFISNQSYDFHNNADIVLPESLQSISAEVFYDCNFSSVLVPQTCKSIGANSFYLPNSILRIFIPSSVISIDEK